MFLDKAVEISGLLSGLVITLGGIVTALVLILKQLNELPKKSRYLVVGVLTNVYFDPPPNVVQTTSRHIALRTCRESPVIVYGVELKDVDKYDFVIVHPRPFHNAANLVDTDHTERIDGLWKDKYRD